MSVKIRRITAFLLALSLLCTLAVQTAFAAVAADYKFEGGSVTVDGTEDKTVDVNFISVKGDDAFQADWLPGTGRYFLCYPHCPDARRYGKPHGR